VAQSAPPWPFSFRPRRFSKPSAWCSWRISTSARSRWGSVCAIARTRVSRQRRESPTRRCAARLSASSRRRADRARVRHSARAQGRDARRLRRGRGRQRPRRRRERRRSGAAHRLRRSRERHQAAWITSSIDMPFARASAELVYLSQTKDFAGTARGRDDHLGTHGVSSRALSDERSSATASTNPLSLSSTIWTSAVRTLPSACKTSRSRRAVTRCR
jgi:hypothetical protein